MLVEQVWFFLKYLLLWLYCNDYQHLHKKLITDMAYLSSQRDTHSETYCWVVYSLGLHMGHMGLKGTHWHHLHTGDLQILLGICIYSHPPDVWSRFVRISLLNHFVTFLLNYLFRTTNAQIMVMVKKNKRLLECRGTAKRTTQRKINKST